MLGRLLNKGVMMKKISFALALTSFVLSACVTINIYFPAAAAEKAADKIIEEVWQHADKPVMKNAK
jgi:starvation-inducible outer membrane lipoprotein